MSTTQQRETVELSSLNDEEKQEYLSERLKKFWLTIIVCCIYGVIAFALLLVAVFTSWGNKVLYSEMFAFVVTFIIGTIIIIIYLADEIYNFKPTKALNNVGYDSQICPDYWKLQHVPDDQLNPKDSMGAYFRTNNVNQFKYKCVLDNTIIDANKLKENDAIKGDMQKKNYKYNANSRLYIPLTTKSQIGLNNDDDFENFKSYAATMSGYTYSNNRLSQNNGNSLQPLTGDNFNDSKIPLACDTVYPMYLADIDRQNVEKNPSEPSNKYRCAFAKACGLPWTEAGCI
jgi:hypothetical protein